MIVQVDKRAQILRFLSDGMFHSGNTLAKTLDISRAAVWKHMSALRKAGVVIESVKGKGYRIENGLDLLDRRVIHQHVAQDMEITILWQTDSTNSWLMQHKDAPRQKKACLAERQAKGRGTRGRQWHSPFGVNIYLSWHWQFEQAPGALGGLSLAVATGICTVLSRCGHQDIAIKWPNDIYTSRGKLGGVLIDLTAESHGPSDVVIGVGLNMGMPEHLRAGVDLPVADLFDEPSMRHYSRSLLAARLINMLNDVCTEFEQRLFGAFVPRWSQWDMLYGRSVQLETPNGRKTGIAQGVDETGAIRLWIDEQAQYFVSGDVTLRLSDAVVN